MILLLSSATPIPGNEGAVGRTIDNLLRLGCHVVYGKDRGIHVSGHASQEELKTMLNLVRPEYFIRFMVSTVCYVVMVNLVWLGVDPKKVPSAIMVKSLNLIKTVAVRVAV